MKIYNVCILEEESITTADAKAFFKKEDADKYAEETLSRWLCDNEESEVNRRYENHIYAFNDDYSISIDIEEQELN